MWDRRFDQLKRLRMLAGALLSGAGSVPHARAQMPHMGRFDEAREIVARLRAITVDVLPKIIELRNPEHRELLLSGLRLAAGEEK